MPASGVSEDLIKQYRFQSFNPYSKLHWEQLCYYDYYHWFLKDPHEDK